MTAITSDTTIDMGQVAMLTCLGFGEHGVEVDWYLNGVQLINTSLITVYERDVTWGGGAFKQSILQLCSVGVKSVGNYTCTVRSGLTTVNELTQLTVQGYRIHIIRVWSYYLIKYCRRRSGTDI